jgi:hypothetical protein
MYKCVAIFIKKFGLNLHNLIEYGHHMNMESPMALAHSCFGRFTKWFIITLSNLWTNDTSFHPFLLPIFWFHQIDKFYLFIYFVVVVVVAIIHILHCKNMLFPNFFLDFFEKTFKNLQHESTTFRQKSNAYFFKY